MSLRLALLLLLGAFFATLVQAEPNLSQPNYDRDGLGSVRSVVHLSDGQTVQRLRYDTYGVAAR
jgi:hypothetical protein